jgi:hypothetical protein
MVRKKPHACEIDRDYQTNERFIEASAGVRVDLQLCEVGERVDYPGSGDHFFFPSPPFPANTATGILDPTEMSV